MNGYLDRLTAFIEALERAGHGSAIVSCRYGHEAHWPGLTNEYVPLHAGDLRNLLDENERLRAVITDEHGRLSRRLGE